MRNCVRFPLNKISVLKARMSTDISEADAELLLAEEGALP